MKNKLLGSIVLLLMQGFLLGLGLSARDVNTARRVADAFQNQKISTGYLAPASPMQLVLEGKQSAGSSAYYIFNGAQNFVVIAGDDDLPAVIGYSDQGAFDPNEIPP